MPKAIATGDPQTILRIYDTYNPKFSTFEDSPNYRLLDGRRFRKFVSRMGDIESASFDRKNLRVDLLTDRIAIVTGIDDWEVKRPGRVRKATSRFTIVFWKKRGWKIIHEHFTEIL